MFGRAARRFRRARALDGQQVTMQINQTHDRLIYTVPETP